MLTRAQNNLYWREWSAAKRALMPGRDTWTKHEENERRHLAHVHALGHDKSHLDFTNDDFDKVLGELRAISKPGDLNAQLRQVRGAHRRARYALDQLIRELGVDRNYVEAIIDQMAFLHPSSFSPHPSLDSLTEPELKKVIIALRKQVKRAREQVTRAQPEPAEVPF
jgi:hypothetical protein